jgi:hypothetical protein
LVNTPMSPRPTPVTSPVARWEAEDDEEREEVRVCKGWSAIPATAPGMGDYMYAVLRLYQLHNPDYVFMHL